MDLSSNEADESRLRVGCCSSGLLTMITGIFLNH